MNVLIGASIISCVAILVVIAYSSFTLSYGEEEELSSASVHVIHTVSTDIMIIAGEHDTLHLQTVTDVAYKQNQTSRRSGTRSDWVLFLLSAKGWCGLSHEKMLVLLRERCSEYP